MRKTTHADPHPLRTLRRARTMNQTQLANLAGVSQQTISKAERGIVIPSFAVQERICAILGASRSDVFPEQVTL